MQGKLNEGKAGSARCNKEYQVKCRKNTEQTTTKIQSKMPQKYKVDKRISNKISNFAPKIKQTP